MDEGRPTRVTGLRHERAENLQCPEEDLSVSAPRGQGLIYFTYVDYAPYDPYKPPLEIFRDSCNNKKC